MAKKINSSLLSIITAVAYIVIGVLYIILKKEALDYIIWIAGIIFVVQGVIDLLLTPKKIVGIVEIAIGAIILIVGAANIANIALIVLGVLIAANGVFSLVYGPKLVLPIVMSVLTIVVGVLLICSKWASDWLFIILGVSFIVDGVLVLFGKKAAY